MGARVAGRAGLRWAGRAGRARVGERVAGRRRPADGWRAYGWRTARRLTPILQSFLVRGVNEGLMFVVHTNPSSFELAGRKPEGLVLVENLNPSSTLPCWCD